MIIILVIIVGGYACILAAGYVGFVIGKKYAPAIRAEKSIAVVVAVRDEEHEIRNLLNELDEQDVQAPFEVIIADDGSADRTLEIAGSYQPRRFSVQVIQSPGTGKKSALEAGVNSTGAEIILFTDGDCRPASSWISSHLDLFSDSRVVMTAGMVENDRQPTVLSLTLQTEMIFLQAMSAGFHGLGSPLMCNGANMAFRRNAFIEVNGYDGNVYVSGDDVQLFQKITTRYPNGVRWNYTRAGFVTTRAASSVGEAITQRRRWLSKWGMFRSFAGTVTALVFLLVQLLFPAAIVLSAASGEWNNPLVYALLARSGVELLFLSLTAPYFGQYQVLPAFPVSVILYNVIAIGSVIKLIFTPMKWKGREWRRGKLS